MLQAAENARWSYSTTTEEERDVRSEIAETIRTLRLFFEIKYGADITPLHPTYDEPNLRQKLP